MSPSPGEVRTVNLTPIQDEAARSPELDPLVVRLRERIDSDDLLLVPLDPDGPAPRAAEGNASPGPMFGAVLLQTASALRFIQARAWPTGLRALIRTLVFKPTCGSPGCDSPACGIVFCHADSLAQTSLPSVPGNEWPHTIALQQVAHDRQIALVWLVSPNMVDLGIIQHGMICSLFTHLHERLIREQQVNAQTMAATLATLLNLLPEPAYLVTGHHVHACNPAARAAGTEDHTRIRNALAGHPAAHGLTMMPFAIPGSIPSHLVVATARPPTVTERLERMADRFHLTPRQREVFRQLCQGLSNKEIAIKLCCAENNVEAHITKILAKVGVDRRGALLARICQEL